MQALGLLEKYSQFISGFEGELLGLSGFGDEHMPEETEHMYQQLGPHVFHVKTVPYQSTSFGKVVAGLDKEPPKKMAPKNKPITSVIPATMASLLFSFLKLFVFIIVLFFYVNFRTGKIT